MTTYSWTFAAALLTTAASASAQLSFSGHYSQNFDSLAASGSANVWTNDSTLPGWWAFDRNGTAGAQDTLEITPTALTTYAGRPGGSNTAGLISWGAIGSSDRALGSIASNGTGDFIYVLALQNTTATTRFRGFFWSLAVEQWHAGNTTDAQTYEASVSVVSSFNIANVSNPGAFPFAGWTEFLFGGLPQIGAVGIDGNAAANRVADSSSVALPIPPGSTLILRFWDDNQTGGDHGWGVDDLTITGVCPSDLGKQGGLSGFDGLLDNNDFVVFIELFFQNDANADLGIQGGTPGIDGLFDNNDFVVFIDGFFTGC